MVCSIQVDGDDVTEHPIMSFTELKSRFQLEPPCILDNLLRAGWTAPTLVQSEAIPIMLARRDVICCAPTGSGKTAAFVLPMVASMKNTHIEHAPRGLIIVPTRELAQQVHRVVEQLCEGTVVQASLLSSERSAKPSRWKNNGYRDIIVATPLRLLQLIKSGLLSLASIEHLVLDEADRLFESDFVLQSDSVFAMCTNPKLMKTMFSATIGERPERLASAIMFSPVRLIIGGRVATLSDDLIHQELVYVGTEAGKLVHFRSLLQEGLEPPVLIFVQNRERAAELFQLLSYDKINVDILTSDRTELQRKITVQQFREGIVWVLVTTDVLGRGIDFLGVNVVINWDMPKSIPDYVHRVGRTGRAGRPGKAISYFEKQDVMLAKSACHLIDNAGGHAPDWLRNTTRKDLQSQARKYALNELDRPRQPLQNGGGGANKKTKKKTKQMTKSLH